VPYKAAAQMIQDTASGTTTGMVSSIAAAEAVVQAGKVRRLAVTSEKRFPGLPDVPSLIAQWTAVAKATNIKVG
jgi:tripartite-type tricarboxylate transporter receptor subunit TctC